MLYPGCRRCRHLKRNQCGKNADAPINMEIGSIIEYAFEPEKDRKCQDFEEDPEPGDPIMV